MTQRAFFQSVTVIRGRVQDIQFDVLGVDDLPSLATVAVTSFEGRVGAVTMEVGDLTGLAVTSFNGRTDNVTFATTDMEVIAALAGTYTNATVTVDQYGRVTIAASGTAPVTSVTSSGGTITVTGTTTSNVEIALGHANTWTVIQTIDLAADTKAIVLQEHSSQTANILEIQDSSGNKRVYIGYDDPLSGSSDSRMIGLRPGTRTYGIGTDDPSGAFNFTRSDIATNAFRVGIEASQVSFSALSNSSRLYVIGNGGLVLSGGEAGGAEDMQFGRRPSDSSATVGVSAEFWPATGQTTPVISTVKPGGGTGGASPLQYRFYVDLEGDIYCKYESSTTNARARFSIVSTWVDSTDASRKARAVVSVYDTAAREALRMEASGSAPMIGFLGASAVVQQTSGADLTNNVTSGGTSDTIADYSDLVIYANDAAAIRNDIYQLARKLKQVNDALRLYGLLS